MAGAVARPEAALLEHPRRRRRSSAALRYALSRRRPPWLAPALRCARQAAGRASTAASDEASACAAAARRVGETRSLAERALLLQATMKAARSACGCGRVRSLRPGPQGRALAGTARLGFVYSAARSPTKLVPLRRLHGRRRFAPARAGLRCAPPTVPALKLR